MDTVTTSERTCTIKRNVVLSVWVRAEFPMPRWERERLMDGVWVRLSPDENGKLLEAKCREFVEFLRDHRSQDRIELEVVRERADLCSACGRTWEPSVEDGVTGCAGCGAILVE